MTKNPMIIENFFNQKKLYIQNGFACGGWNDLGQGIIQLRPFNVSTNGQIDLTTVKYIEVERNLSRYLLQKNDVIFNNTNSEELVGKTALWSQTLNAVLSNHMTIVRVLDENELSPQFLSFYLLKKWMDGYFHQVCQRHVNQASVSIERLKATPFPEFGIVEQRRIAHILSTVQTAIEQQERMIALTRELKSAVMHKLFTEGLRGEKQKQTEIGLIPESWHIAKVGELFKIAYKHSNYKLPQPIPFIPMDLIPIGKCEINQYEFREKVTSGTYVENGDFLLAKITPSFENGKQGILNIPYSNGFATTEVIPIKAIQGKSYLFFLHYYLQIPEIRSIMAGKMEGSTGRQRLSKSVVSDLLIPMPPIFEQEEIANTLRVFDEVCGIREKKICSLNDLFHSLLHQLMTGQIRVNEIEIEEFS